MGKTFFIVYSIVLALLMFWILWTPVLAFDHPYEAGNYYQIGSYLCHQKISRSLCVFKSPTGYFIGDCTIQNGKFVQGDNRLTGAINPKGEVGYKMPVCSRDVGIYLAMLIGGLAYPFFRKIESKEVPPSLWLVLAIIPLGIDGTMQLLSNIGFQLPVFGLYESTNLIRLLTGLLAGFVLPFYIFPMVNVFAWRKGKTGEAHAKQN